MIFLRQSRSRVGEAVRLRCKVVFEEPCERSYVSALAFGARTPALRAYKRSHLVSPFFDERDSFVELRRLNPKPFCSFTSLSFNQLGSFPEQTPQAPGLSSLPPQLAFSPSPAARILRAAANTLGTRALSTPAIPSGPGGPWPTLRRAYGRFKSFIYVGFIFGALWLTYNTLFAYFFVLGLSYIIQAINDSSCMETLIPELVQQNARLNLGFATINPSGQICMMDTPPPGHPCEGLDVVTQKTQSDGSVQVCFHYDAWLKCVGKTNDWGALKSHLTDWSSGQANLKGKVYCLNVPGTESKPSR